MFMLIPFGDGQEKHKWALGHLVEISEQEKCIKEQG